MMMYSPNVTSEHTLGVHRAEMDAARPAKVTLKEDGEMPKSDIGSQIVRSTLIDKPHGMIPRTSAMHTARRAVG
jgi:hypothetical protein